MGAKYIMGQFKHSCAVIDNHICRAPTMIWENAYDEIKFTVDIICTE